MKILISGASGLVGKALSDFLKQKGHDVRTLLRRPAQASSHEIFFWNPSRGELAVESASGFDAISSKRSSDSFSLSGLCGLSGRKTILEQRQKVFSPLRPQRPLRGFYEDLNFRRLRTGR